MSGWLGEKCSLSFISLCLCPERVSYMATDYKSPLKQACDETSRSACLRGGGSDRARRWARPGEGWAQKPALRSSPHPPPAPQLSSFRDEVKQKTRKTCLPGEAAEVIHRLRNRPPATSWALAQALGTQRRCLGPDPALRPPHWGIPASGPLSHPNCSN